MYYMEIYVKFCAIFNRISQSLRNLITYYILCMRNDHIHHNRITTYGSYIVVIVVPVEAISPLDC